MLLLLSPIHQLAKRDDIAFLNCGRKTTKFGRGVARGFGCKRKALILVLPWGPAAVGDMLLLLRKSRASWLDITLLCFFLLCVAAAMAAIDISRLEEVAEKREVILIAMGREVTYKVSCFKFSV